MTVDKTDRAITLYLEPKEKNMKIKIGSYTHINKVIYAYKLPLHNNNNKHE